MSVARKHFWWVVSNAAGASFWPRKYGFNGCMPALISSVEVSSGGGISGAEGSRRWPLDSKYRRKPSRSSGVVRIATILGAASTVGSAAGDDDQRVLRRATGRERPATGRLRRHAIRGARADVTRGDGNGSLPTRGVRWRRLRGCR